MLEANETHTNIFIKLGVGLIVVSLFLGLLFFYPVLLQEAHYFILGSQNQNKEVVLSDDESEKSVENTGTPSKNNEIIPLSTEFGIVIPKINANAKVIPNVSPYDSKEYQKALTKGVAHAEGTAFPGQLGNSFIFSHSSVNFYEAARYNSVFYLLNKLESGDKFYLIYDNEKFEYRVSETKITEAGDVKYLQNNLNGKSTVTLMTCWPPGTTLKRYIVVGELVN